MGTRAARTAVPWVLLAAVVGAAPSPALASVSPSAEPSASVPDQPTSGPTDVEPSPAEPTALPAPSDEVRDDRSSPAPAPKPLPTLALPAPPSDGAGPAAGQIDEYLRLAEERQRLVDELAKATAAIEDADARLLARAGEARTAALRASVARIWRESATDDVDDVVRQLYQGGDSGLASLAYVVTAGPDSFVEHLGNIASVRAATNGIAAQAESAIVAVRAAEVTASTATGRVQEAARDRTRAARAQARAQARLAAVDRALDRLAALPPQVAVGPEGCPKADLPATLRDGAASLGARRLCTYAVREAPTPQAALAITWAFRHLGAAYACGGAGRLLPFRADCSSFVARAYAEGAGLRTAGDGWAPSTRDMVPWDGVALDPHYAYVPPSGLRPGDLVLYDTCRQGGCPYKHVVLYLGDPDGGPGWMLHTNSCGDVAKVERFWGTGSSASHRFLVARRVVALPGETLAASPGGAPRRG